MNNLKYKVWDKGKKIMYQPGDICRVHFDNGIPYAVFMWNDNTIFGGCFVLLQYIGLNDKNDKEIYKGDIIKWQAGYYKAKRNQTVVDSIILDGGCFKTKRFKMPIAAIPGCEIIGNIYENSEFLEEK